MLNRQSILITGGAGFVGSTLARVFCERDPECRIVCMDNLRRRGSELLVSELERCGIEFIHGDIRDPRDFPSDLASPLVIECSAEPSVLAGYTSPPDYLIATNLRGAANCLEFCRQYRGDIIFLSTSRVYSVESLCRLQLRERASRFEFDDHQEIPGASQFGISEAFSTGAPRSLYGTTKLAAELLVEEFSHAYGIRAVMNRCGVLAGPWQLARPDQGIFTFWLWRHFVRGTLRYIGFEGTGKQVRDLLDCRDLADLLFEQAADLDFWNGWKGNIGGGLENSLSLLEATRLCCDITGNEVSVESDPSPREMDIPWYVSDCRLLKNKTKWIPRRSPRDILVDTYMWMKEHELSLRTVLPL